MNPGAKNRNHFFLTPLLLPIETCYNICVSTYSNKVITKGFYDA